MSSLRKTLNVHMRLAVVQLQSHQAAIVGGRDFLAEPFVDDDKLLPLDYLISAGLAQFEDARAECRNKYLDWHTKRVTAVLDYLGDMTTRSQFWDKESERPHIPRLRADLLLITFPGILNSIRITTDRFRLGSQIFRAI